MADELIGRMLRQGEYEILSVLGRGGMATVYRARSHSLDTDVAVKVLAPRLANDPGFKERFHDEARGLASLHHPNLVEVHHHGEEGDLVYIVMRLVPDGTLKDRLQALGQPVDSISTARIIGQVADGLQHAHDRGLIHLDIKPANILLGRADWPLLADFGITRALGRQQSRDGGERLAGTPLYMSPEHWRGGPVDGRSDEYALAISAYEMLTGRRPFQGETTADLQRMHQVEPPPRPRDVNPGIPASVEQVLLRGLAKAPDDRYPTIAEFGEALNQAAESARGVTRETKEALATSAPNLLGILALTMLTPLLLLILPNTGIPGAQLPLAWPFQWLVAALLSALLLGLRGNLISLMSRFLIAATGAMIRPRDAADGRLSARAAGPAPWRAALVGSAQGAVNLASLFVVYQLVAAPTLTIVGALTDQSIQRYATAVVTVLVALITIVLIVGIFRAAGPIAAGVLLAISWAATAILPPVQAVGYQTESVSWAVRTVVGVGALLALFAIRPSVQTLVRGVSIASLWRILVEATPGMTEEQATRAKDRLQNTAGAVGDLLYLLVGYALLRQPLVEGLTPALGAIPAAILVAGLAALIWLLLLARLWFIAGALGGALAVMLGAPLILTLPIWDVAVVGVPWPATIAAWTVGTVLVLLLTLVRGQIQTVSQRAIGGHVDRGILGTRSAQDEDRAARRSSALGGLFGAAIDLAFLLIGFYALGLPIARSLAAGTNRPEIGSILLAGLFFAALGIISGPLQRAIAALADAGGQRPATLLRATPGLAVAAAAMLVGGCAAAPTTLVAPSVVGGIALTTTRGPSVVIDWEHWLPWTPSPEHATYNISLSCSDGRQLGAFREAFHVPQDARMPSGTVGQLGPTGVPCDEWRAVYLDRRLAAGVIGEPTHSWDWLDVGITLNSDNSIDVVETHRVLFTSGATGQLAHAIAVQAPPSAAASLDPRSRLVSLTTADLQTTTRRLADAPADVEVLEGDQSFPMGQGDDPSGRHARVAVENGVTVVSWSFPPIVAPAERTYTLKYRIADALVARPGKLVLSKEIVGGQEEAPVWRTTVGVRFSRAVPGTRLDSTGAPSRSGFLDSQNGWYEARDVAPGQPFGVVVEIPSDEPPTPTPEPTSTPTSTPGSTPQPTNTVAPTPTPVPSATATQAPTIAPTARPTLSPTPSPPASTPTTPPPPTAAPTTPPSPTAQPTASSTPAITPTPTISPTTVPTPTFTPTRRPTIAPTPTFTPTSPPIIVTIIPRVLATATPTPRLIIVTMIPRILPTATPTQIMIY